MKAVGPDKELENGRDSGTGHPSGISSCRKRGADGQSQHGEREGTHSPGARIRIWGTGDCLLAWVKHGYVVESCKCLDDR